MGLGSLLIGTLLLPHESMKGSIPPGEVLPAFRHSGGNVEVHEVQDSSLEGFPVFLNRVEMTGIHELGVVVVVVLHMPGSPGCSP